nr:hypothetical protein [Tanacetum cinerariifolium]
MEVMVVHSRLTMVHTPKFIHSCYEISFTDVENRQEQILLPIQTNSLQKHSETVSSLAKADMHKDISVEPNGVSFRLPFSVLHLHWFGAIAEYITAEVYVVIELDNGLRDNEIEDFLNLSY